MEVKMGIPSFGQLLVDDGIITDEQLESALAMQRSRRDQRNLIGVILIRLGYISKETLVKYLAIQTEMLMKEYPEKSVPHLGELLVKDGEITEEQLKKALSQQEMKGPAPLGIILMKMNAIDSDVLVKYLVRQTAMAVSDEGEG